MSVPGRRLSALAESGRSLVVMVHGFMGHRLQLVPAAGVLSARGHDVYNFAYRSRAHTLDAHAETLSDAVSHWARGRPVRFVTHSFGGVVLSAAAAGGGLVVERAVLVAPPARGCKFARDMAVGAPDMLPEAAQSAVRAAAGLFLGGESGQQLATMGAAWFEDTQDAHKGLGGKTPRALVVAGNVGALNPLVEGYSDGCVTLEETRLHVPHFRVEEPVTHNLLLYAPRVLTSIADFIDGKDIGELYDPAEGDAERRRRDVGVDG